MQQIIDMKDNNRQLFTFIESTYETHEQLNEILHDEKRNPQLFDLAQGLVFRCHLVYYKSISSNRLLSDKDLIIFNFHHALFDFPSMNIFLHDLNQAYTTGQLLYDDSTTLRYIDYAVIEQQMSMTGASMFWLDALHDCKLDQPLSLPFDRYRLANEHRTGRGTSICFDFGQDLSHDFLIQASSNNISLEHLTFAVYFIFLFKLTNGQTDLCLARNIKNNRYRDELKSIIGLFENIIPLRCQLDPHWSFHQLLEHVQKITTNSLKYAYFPLQRILNQHSHTSKHTFLDTSLESISYNSNNDNNAIMIGDSQLVPTPSSFNENDDEILNLSDFSLSIYHDMNVNQLSCTIKASLALFNRESVEKISQRFHSILHQLSTSIIDSQINKPIYEVSLILSNEQYLMQSMNNTQISFSSPLTCIHHEFVYQVMKHPQKLAVELDEQSLTYCELLYYIQILSLTLLNEYNVFPGEIVCQCVERSLSMVIGIVAIEMGGGIYCPLSPRDPQHRLHALTQQTQSRLVLVHHVTKTKLDDDIISLDIDSILINSYVVSDVYVDRLSSVTVTHNDIAYIIFTSGSTGIPKAVQVRHKNFTRYMYSFVSASALKKDDVTVQMARSTFDVHLQEIAGVLLIGATLVMLHPTGIMDFHYLGNVMIKKNITYFASVPTIINNFFTFLQQQNYHNVARYLRLVCSGGEPCSVKLINLVSNTLTHTCRILNMYGTAETTIDCTFHLFDNTMETENIPIGRPLLNYQNLVLDEFSQSMFINQEGELFVGGAGVFAGYLGRDDLTAKALVEIDGQLFYRTGDLIRMDKNNLIYYRGRKDHQIKLHGQRIELGEIERCLLNTSVSACIAMKWKDDHLVAYVQSSDIDENVLREHCQLHLPPHMIPSIFVILEKLPLNANGKIDRKLLPPPNFSSITISNNEAQYIEPNDIVEMKIHLIWCEILQRTDISINTSFFSIGGHSLLLMKLYHRYKVVFNLDSRTINIAQLIEQFTIAEHASLIKHWSDYVQQDVDSWYLLNFTSDDSITDGLSSSSKGRLYIRHKNIDDLSQDVTMIIEQLEKSYLSAVIQEIYIMWITDPRFNENNQLNQRLAAIVVSQAYELTVLEELEKISNRKHFHNVQIPWALLIEKESHSTLLKGMNREILEKHYRTKITNILLANVTIDTSSNITEQERSTQSHTLIEHDKLLDPSLQPSIKTNNKEKCKDIFLTGSTGFLGTYLLDELLKQTDANIYCLVRSKKSTDTLQSRVIYLYGDLTLPQLGLHDDQYSMLVSKMRSIYHCGADVNVIKSYTDLRSANVLGTLELIKLACLANCRINYISTLSVLDENDQSGYVQSKQVSECLMKQASERDLTVSILRPAFHIESPPIDVPIGQLGGTSLDAIHALTVIRQQVHTNIDIGLLFANPSIRQLSIAIEPLLVSNQSQETVFTVNQSHETYVHLAPSFVVESIGVIVLFCQCLWPIIIIHQRCPFFFSFLPAFHLIFYAICSRLFSLQNNKTDIVFSWNYYRWWFLDRLWNNNTFWLQHLLGTPLYNYYLHFCGARISINAHIYTTTIDAPWLLEIGDGSWIANETCLNCLYFNDNNTFKLSPIKIGSNCSVGTRSILYDGVDMENNIIVQPMSSVTGSIASKTVIDGEEHKPISSDNCITCNKRSLSIWHKIYQVIVLISLICIHCTILIFVYKIYSIEHIPLPISIAFSWTLWSILGCFVSVFLLKYVIGSCVAGDTYSIASWSYLHKLWIRQLIVSSFRHAWLLPSAYDDIYPFVLRWLGAYIEDNVKLYDIGIFLSYPKNLLKLETGVTIFGYVLLVPTEMTLSGDHCVDRITLGAHANLANRCSVLPGSHLASETMVGNLTRISREINSKQGDVFIGVPARVMPFKMPLRSNITDQIEITSLWHTCFWHFISKCLLINIYLLGGFIGGPVIHITLICSFYRWNSSIRYELVQHILGRLTHDCQQFICPFFSNTQWLIRLFRGFGAYIGKGVVLPDFSCITYYHLITIGDNVRLNIHANIQCHSFEQRSLKLAPVAIGNSCVLMSGSYVMAGCKLMGNNKLYPFTLIMKNDQLPPNTHWRGLPAQSCTVKVKLSQPTIVHDDLVKYQQGYETIDKLFLWYERIASIYTSVNELQFMNYDYADMDEYIDDHTGYYSRKLYEQ
ncbi:unnamed protein product, partial [Adineta steineri]